MFWGLFHHLGEFLGASSHILYFFEHIVRRAVVAIAVHFQGQPAAVSNILQCLDNSVKVDIHRKGQLVMVSTAVVIVDVQRLQMVSQGVDHRRRSGVHTLHSSVTDVQAGYKIRIVHRIQMGQKTSRIAAGSRRGVIIAGIPVPHILRSNLYAAALGKGQQLQIARPAKMAKVARYAHSAL